MLVEILLAVLVEALLTALLIGCAVISGAVLTLGPHGAGWPLGRPRSDDGRGRRPAGVR